MVVLDAYWPSHGYRLRASAEIEPREFAHKWSQGVRRKRVPLNTTARGCSHGFGDAAPPLDRFGRAGLRWGLPHREPGLTILAETHLVSRSTSAHRSPRLLGTIAGRVDSQRDQRAPPLSMMAGGESSRTSGRAPDSLTDHTDGG